MVTFAIASKSCWASLSFGHFPTRSRFCSSSSLRLRSPRLTWKRGLSPIFWNPTAGWAIGLGAAFFAALIRLQDPSTFLYFQF